MERGAEGVHVPVPLRRPLPDHARRPPPRGGDCALPLVLALPHRRLQRRGLRRRQGADPEAVPEPSRRRLMWPVPGEMVRPLFPGSFCSRSEILPFDEAFCYMSRLNQSVAMKFWVQ